MLFWILVTWMFVWNNTDVSPKSPNKLSVLQGDQYQCDSLETYR